MSEHLYVVMYQRYPSDDISQRSFSSSADANSFFNAKQEDYRYTVGRVWMKTYQEVKK